jgi:capsular exopolysaccharide synthesis family protein
MIRSHGSGGRPALVDPARAVPTQPAAVQGHRPASTDTLLHFVWRQRRLMALCVTIAVALMSAYLLVARPQWTATAMVYVAPSAPGLLADGAGASPADDNFFNYQCQVIKSSPVLALALGNCDTEHMQTFRGQHNRLSYLKKLVNAEVGKRDDIIDISFEGPSADEACTVVNAVLDAYAESQRKERLATGDQMVDILAREKAKCDQQLAEKTQQLGDLQVGQKMMVVGDDNANMSLGAQRLSALSAAITESHIQTITAENDFKETAQGLGIDPAHLGNDGVASASGMASVADEDSIRSEIFRQQQQLDQLSRQYMGNNPAIVSLKNRIHDLSRSLLLCVRQRYLAARGRESDLQASYDREQANLLGQSSHNFACRQISEEIKRLAEQSDALDKRMRELTLSAQAGALNISPVERAVASEQPTSPNKRKLLPIAAGAGLAIALLIGLIQEARSGRLRLDSHAPGGEEAASIGGLRVFTVLAPQPGVDTTRLALDAHFRPSASLAESFRDVCDAIDTAAASSKFLKARSIAITSCVSGEGRTTCASNLAIALAGIGRSVCLVEADMHGPTLASLYSTRPNPGLSSVLSGSSRIETTLVPTAVERLDLLCAGPRPQDSAELLNSLAFTELLEELTTRYDHVIVDSPALLSGPDARIVASACETTILVVASEQVSQRLVKRCLDGLSAVGAEVIGAIVNSVARVERQRELRPPTRVVQELAAAS